MSERMRKAGEALRLAAVETLLAVQPWQRRVFSHLMLVEEKRNQATAVGMDPAIVDAIVEDVRSEACTRPDGDSDWVDRQVTERFGRAVEAFVAGQEVTRHDPLAPYREALYRACQNLLDAPDQSTPDPNPDRCWRCDASPAVCDIGLCTPCRADLT